MKTPLVLLPGMLCHHQQWAHQTAHLADVADVTVADLSQHDSMREMAESVLALAPPQFALAGLSMGGIVAMELLVTDTEPPSASPLSSPSCC
jgi:pimeloyl-ACP methyl ester carboxylesterase